MTQEWNHNGFIAKLDVDTTFDHLEARAVEQALLEHDTPT